MKTVKMPAEDERKARALHELDVVAYFGLTRREALFYRLLCLLRHRHEMKFARVVARELDNEDGVELSDFGRARLLGLIEGLFSSKAISEHMNLMLQVAVQDRKHSSHEADETLALSSLVEAKRAGYVFSDR